MTARTPAVSVAAAALVAVLAVPAPAAADPPPVPDPLGLLEPPPEPSDPPDPDEPDLPDVPGRDDGDGEDGEEGGGQTADEAALRAAVVGIARGELRRARARESGDNCVFYNSAVDADGRRCGIEWCAQFVRWAWREAGADVAGLSHRPASLREYGREHRTWHPGEKLTGLRPGDAVVFRLDQPGRLGHANIVVAVRGKRVTTIGGNEKGGAVRRTTWRIGDERQYGYVSGYTSPVPHGRAGPPP